MAPIGLGTAVILVVLQLSVSNYLKRRGIRDLQVLSNDTAFISRYLNADVGYASGIHCDFQAAEEASRVASESIEYVRTVQALNRQQYAHRAFCAAARRPHRMAITRGKKKELEI